MTIAVLAVQGAFIEHEKKLEKLGATCIELRKAEDLKQHYDGLVLPGGESTVQGKLLKELGMYDTLKSQIESGMPVLATCAGMILLAEKIEGGEAGHLQTMPVTVKRNAYGRQLGSFHTEADISNGTIVANEKDAAIYNNGYTTINANVTHTGTGTNSFYAILNHGDMVINGGSFADGLITVKTDEGGITVINDGTFSNKNICIESWNDTTINGGQFTGAGNESVFYAGKYNSHTDGTLKIKGGKFTGSSLIASGDAYTGQANVTIESADLSRVDRLFSNSTSTKKPTVTIAETSTQPQTTSQEFITDITWDDENSANRPGLAKFKEMLTVVDDNGNPLTANIELAEDPNNASVTIVKYTVNYDKYNADGTEAAAPNANLTIDNDKLNAAGYEAVNPDSPFILSPKPQEPTDTIEPTEPSKPTKDNKTDIKLNSAEGQKAPQTGVTSNAPLYTLLAAGAVCGACVAAWAIKRKTAK